MAGPKVLLCDEPVSALDVSIQAQVVNLLKELQREMGLALVFVAHDLGVVRHISDEVLVMYMGAQMERAPAADLIRAPLHPYAKALLSAVPVPDPNVRIEPQMLEGRLAQPYGPAAWVPVCVALPAGNGKMHQGKTASRAPQRS